MQISVGVALQGFVCNVVDFHVIAVRPASVSIAPLNWSKFYESTAGFFYDYHILAFKYSHLFQIKYFCLAHHFLFFRQETN